MQRRVGIAVVGVGYWGPGLVRNLAGLGEAEVRHVVDRIESRAHDCTRRFAPSALANQDLHAALADDHCDAVVIATPAISHEELALQALAHGKHVFVEKPLAMSVEGADRLIAAARVADRVLMVGHIFRFHPAVECIARYIADGTLGDVLYVHSRRHNLGRVQADINALWSFAPHDLSILRHWLGQDPRSVSATGFSYVQEGVEDVVFATLQHDRGIGAHLHLSWLDPCKVRETTVVGSRRMVVFDDVSPDQKIRVYDSSVGPIRRSPQSFAEWAVDVRAGDVTIPRVPWVEPLRRELEHFLDCVRGRAECLTPGEEGRAVCATLEALQKSLRLGGAPTDRSPRDV